MKPERFTEQAQEVISDSQRLVLEYQQQQWDVEHVFLALIKQASGLTGEVFKSLGVDTALIASRVETALSATPKVQQPENQVYATPRIARLLDNAESEAKLLLSGEFREGDHVVVDVEGEQLTFSSREKVVAMAS